MRILSDLVTKSNSAEALSDQTVIILARWVTRIVTIFGLDPEGDLNSLDRIGWSGLDIPAPAKPYVYLASQLRDKVRALAFASTGQRPTRLMRPAPRHTPLEPRHLSRGPQTPPSLL